MELTIESVENDENIFAVSFGCRAPVATCTQFPTWRKKLTSVVLRSWFSGQNKVFSRNQIVNISSIDLSNVTAPYSAEGFAFASRFNQEIWQFLRRTEASEKARLQKKERHSGSLFVNQKSISSSSPFDGLFRIQTKTYAHRRPVLESFFFLVKWNLASAKKKRRRSRGKTCDN